MYMYVCVCVDVYFYLPVGFFLYLYIDWLTSVYYLSCVYQCHYLIVSIIHQLPYKHNNHYFFFIYNKHEAKSIGLISFGFLGPVTDQGLI